MKIPSQLIVVLLVLAFVLVLFPQSQAQLMQNTGSGSDMPTAYVITPASGSISALVAAQPPGTAFSLGCGTYRMQAPISPLAGDTFVGAGAISGVPSRPPCAHLTGAMVISNWTHITSPSSLWYNTVAASNIISKPAGACLVGVSSGGSGACTRVGGCSYPQDLFFDSVIKTRITVGDNNTTDNWPPAPGYWYLDISGKHGPANTVYVADDPTGKTVELEVVQFAFLGPNGGVTIQNLTLEKFASPYQHGIIDNGGDKWRVLNNWITHGHGYGIKPNPSNPYNGGHVPRNNLVDSNEFMENGQAGFGDGRDVGSTYSNNDLIRNGEVSFCYGGEGGNKFVGNNINITGNTVNYENGAGLWSDSGATGDTYSNNTVIGSLAEGIRCEISHYCTIIDNRLINDIELSNNACVAAHVPLENGNDCCTGPQTGTCGTACSRGGPDEISSAQSDHSTIGESGHGNSITSNCGGILVSVGTRDSVPTTDNQVLYNDITFTGNGGTAVPHPYGVVGSPGASTTNDVFDHNSHHFQGAGAGARRAKIWGWFDGSANTLNTFSKWQALQQDVNSSAETR